MLHPVALGHEADPNDNHPGPSRYFGTGDGVLTELQGSLPERMTGDRVSRRLRLKSPGLDSSPKAERTL